MTVDLRWGVQNLTNGHSNAFTWALFQIGGTQMYSAYCCNANVKFILLECKRKFVLLQRKRTVHILVTQTIHLHMFMHKSKHQWDLYQISFFLVGTHNISTPNYPKLKKTNKFLLTHLFWQCPWPLWTIEIFLHEKTWKHQSIQLSNWYYKFPKNALKRDVFFET